MVKSGVSAQIVNSYSLCDTMTGEQGDNMSDIIKIRDSDSGEVVEHEVCQSCDGMGGYDASTDCEVYDDFQTCIDCEGMGWVELGHFSKEVFDPVRDAWKPND